MEWKQKEPQEQFYLWDDLETKLCNIYGVKDKEEWLRPTEKSLYWNRLLGNIDKAGNRIIEAIHKNEKIVVYADADFDGISSCVVMTRYLKNHNANVDILYTQRQDGHGIENAIQGLPKDTQLLIIVDSSTNSADACKEISNQGIDIVIIDHHLQSQENPYCILVNNQVCNYPNKELSGVGVTYKVIEYIDEELNKNYASQYIDLVGVGIMADVMSVTEPENRYYIYNALKQVNNIGLKTIIRGMNVTSYNAMAMGFSIAPIINAASRMGKIELAINLLMEDDVDKCKAIFKEIKKLNEERKKKQKKMVEDILPDINSDEKIMVVVTDKTEKSFNGLVAMELTNRFQHPTIVVREENGSCAGSARSYGGFQLKSFLEQSGLFTLLEGHEESFGIGFQLKNLDKIKEYINNNIDESKFIRTLEYDLELDYKDIDENTIQTIRRWNYITGKQFKPINVLIKNVPINNTKVIGKTKETVKFETNSDLGLIKFKVNEEYGQDIWGEIDVVGKLDINKWWHNGLKQWQNDKQVVIEDYKLAE